MKIRRRSATGFTLIEILIAMAVLMIGIVGVLSIFPVGIKNVNDSVKDSTAANVAQSLYNAMIDAMRRGQTTSGQVMLVHDGLPGTVPVSRNYTFTLPASVAVELHPVAGSGTDSTLQTYQLGNDAQTVAVVNDITAPLAWSAGGDPTEPLRQYSYQFEVSKPDFGPDIPLYQFRFLVYRNYRVMTVPVGQKHPDLVKDFMTLIAGSGI